MYKIDIYTYIYTYICIWAINNQVEASVEPWLLFRISFDCMASSTVYTYLPIEVGTMCKTYACNA